MVYILDTKLNEKKTVEYSLQLIYGIGKTTSKKICKMLGFSSNFKLQNLTQIQIDDIEILINDLGLTVSNKLKKKEFEANKKLLVIKSYRGLRKKKGLPVRGQRTHTNAKSSKKFRFK